MKKLALTILIVSGVLPLRSMDSDLGARLSCKVPTLFTIAEKKLHPH